jgi:hypothetical protein
MPGIYVRKSTRAFDAMSGELPAINSDLNVVAGSAFVSMVQECTGDETAKGLLK